MSHIIDIQNLRKKYRVYFEKPALIKNILPFLVSQGKAQEFWALNGVSFSLDQGECMGIIGPNGSGKSTILSILAGVSSPTEGQVSLRGKVSSLLSLGAGFNFELTGQENVYLNGAILGLSKAKIDAIYRDIVAFADLGKFMNAKLSTYSSGMNMRLGFAIAVMVPFDILLMDEILAVGDLSFQTKCFRTMKRFYEDEGKTLVFVSHDLEKIEELCSSVIWFEHGKVEASGSPAEVIAAYKDRYREQFQGLRAVTRAQRGAIRARVTVEAGAAIRRIPPELFGSNVDAFGDGAWLVDRRKQRLNRFAMGPLTALGFKLLRYPGSQHADYFHWQEAIGETRMPQICGADSAKPKHYPHFGPEEFLEMCDALGAAPMVTLNAGTGTPDEAGRWVEWIRERCRAPLYVEIGNELHYDEFHTLGIDFPWTPERYARACAEFSRAVRAADPTALIGVQCCIENGAFTRYRDPRWNEAVFTLPSGSADFLCLHHAILPILNITPDYRTPSEEETWTALLAAPRFVERSIEALAAQARERGVGGGGEIRISLSEYGCLYTNVPNMVHGSHPVHDRNADSVEWGRNHTLAAALYEAGILHVAMRRPEVYIAARPSFFNPLFSSVLRMKPDGTPEHLPQYPMHYLFNRFAGKTLIRAEVEVEGFATPAVGFIPAQEGVPACDVVAVKDAEGRRLAVSVINPSIKSALDLRLDLRDFAPRYISVRQLHGEAPDCDSLLSGPRQVHLIERTARAEEFRGPDGLLRFGIPRHSLVVISFSPEDWI